MEKEKVMFFIDGSNFYKNCKASGCKGEHVVFLDYFSFCSSLLETDNQKLIRVYYYDAPLKSEWDAKRYSLQQQFFTRLRKQRNVELRLGRLQGKYPEITEKGIDILIGVDMIRLAHQNCYDIGYLLSSDGDLAAVVQLCKDLGKNIGNLYFPNLKSYHLNQTCDFSIIIDPNLILKNQLSIK